MSTLGVTYAKKIRFFFFQKSMFYSNLNLFFSKFKNKKNWTLHGEANTNILPDIRPIVTFI